MRAQEERTPFWLPRPPPKKEAEKPKKKPIQIEPIKIKGKEKEKKEAPPPPAAEKQKAPPKKPPPEEPRAPEPTWIEPPPRAAEPSPRTKRAPIEVEPKPAPSIAPSPPPPAPVVIPQSPPPRPIEPPAAAEPAQVMIAEPESEFELVPETRTFSVDGAFGSWAKSGSDGGGRAWQLAYGLRVGYAIFPSLEVEVEVVRAGTTSGSPFVSASTTHNLAALRAFYVLGDRLALLLGGGGGIALVQTHYALLPSTDPGSVATGIDAIAVKPVMQITAAGRVRVFRGLEARAEVSALVRDGKLDLLPLLGAGWAF